MTSIKELKKDIDLLSNRVNSIEVLVAGNYVPKSDLQLIVDVLFSKLDKISDKLDNKVDKNSIL